MNIEQQVDIIINNPLFLRLKGVVENLEGWHDQEDVYAHSLKTFNIAKERLSGDFVTEPQSKTLFLEWADKDIYGMRQKDLSQIIALIHDCGKILKFEERNRQQSLITSQPNRPEQTMCPGHEYWGSKLVVPALLKDIDIPDPTKEYVGQMVEYHGFYSTYFAPRDKYSLEQLIKDAKSHYAGSWIEGLFNMYCDGYSASAFAEGRQKIEQLFNHPDFYTPRRYFISNI